MNCSVFMNPNFPIKSLISQCIVEKLGFSTFHSNTL